MCRENVGKLDDWLCHSAGSATCTDNVCMNVTPNTCGAEWSVFLAAMTYTSSPRYFLTICLIGLCVTLALFLVKPDSYRQSLNDKRVFGRRVPTVTDKDVVTLYKDRKVHVRDACSPSKIICSTSAIKNCAVARNYFPEENRWTHVNATFPGSRFLPTFCRFKHDIVPPTELQRCIQNKPIKHIVVIGDSHGGQYFKSLQELLKPIAVCTQLRERTRRSTIFLGESAIQQNFRNRNATKSDTVYGNALS